LGWGEIRCEQDHSIETDCRSDDIQALIGNLIGLFSLQPSLKAFSGNGNAGEYVRGTNMNRPKSTISSKGNAACHTTAWPELEVCSPVSTLAKSPPKSRVRPAPRTFAQIGEASHTIARRDLNGGEKTSSSTVTVHRASLGIRSTWLQAAQLQDESCSAKSANDMFSRDPRSDGDNFSPGFFFGRSYPIKSNAKREIRSASLSRDAIPAERLTPFQSWSESFGVLELAARAHVPTFRTTGYKI
jgi:hypothetical protein